MVPELTSIVRKRYRMKRTLRFIALMFALCFTVMTSYSLVEPIVWDSNEVRWRDVIRHTPWLIGAALILVTERWSIGWLLPLPRNLCPRCSYSLANLSGDVCPECGISLGDLIDTTRPGCS